MHNNLVLMVHLRISVDFRFASAGISIGGANCGYQYFHGNTATHTHGISAISTISATRDDARVFFMSAGSTFNTLHVQADDGISLQADVMTDIGEMLLDGDSDDSVSFDIDNAVSYTLATSLLISRPSPSLCLFIQFCTSPSF